MSQQPDPQTTPGKPSLVHVAVRQASQHATMTFEELVRGCTAGEREQLAWHLAQMRARKTYEALRVAPTPEDAA